MSWPAFILSPCPGPPSLGAPSLTLCALWLVARRCGEPPPSPLFGSRALLSDYAFDRVAVPTKTVHVLEGHADEVWLVVFSHGGARLASAAKDGVVALWDAASCVRLHALSAHSDTLCALAWSPTDEHLLTCGSDQIIIMWEVASGVRAPQQSTYGMAVPPDGPPHLAGPTRGHTPSAIPSSRNIDTHPSPPQPPPACVCRECVAPPVPWLAGACAHICAPFRVGGRNLVAPIG